MVKEGKKVINKKKIELLAMWNHFNTHLYNTYSERIRFIIRNVFGDCPLLDTNMVAIYFLLFQSKIPNC